MAKLSARGRTVQVTTVREQTIIDPTALCDWRRTTRKLMSDGAVLEKLDVRFRDDGRKHSYGWKVRGKLKAGLTAADYARIYRAPRQDGSPSPWTVTDGDVASTTDPMVDVHPRVTLRRVTAAIERGEYDGFCLACGAEQGSCEPDARGYTCESCRLPRVYGAEECLMMIG